MRDATSIARLQAQLSDVQRRLHWLEHRVDGVAAGVMEASDLTSLYVQASRPEAPTPQLVELWSRTLLRLGTTDFLVMSQWMRDPFPWKPFLMMLTFFYDEGYDVRPQLQHIWARAQELLDIQGLGLLRPGDVMGYPIRIREAIGAISS